MVDKFMGDCLIAIFGVPIPHPDDQLRAVKSALEIQHQLKLLNQTHRDRYPEIQVGIGIASGSAVVGNLGSEERLEYTAIGPPVNRAARLEELAGPNEILISDEVYEATYQKIRVHPHSRLREDGTELQIYKVLDISDNL
jgi:class 3 adenylate cyclase